MILYIIKSEVDTAVDQESPESNSQLRNEFNNFRKQVEDDIQSLKKQNQILAKKLEKFAHKLESFKDLKKEFKAFFSINSYSEALGTNSPIKKSFWLICMVSLFIACMILVDQNVKEYERNDVVTQIKVIENETMAFPAITFCFNDCKYSKDLTVTYFRTLNISEVFYDCFFENPTRKCSPNDFENFQVINGRYGYANDCYKFNGGKNATNHKTPLVLPSKFGKFTGLVMRFNMSKYGSLFFYVGDNFVKPVFAELANIIQAGKWANIGILKAVDKKLPEPYNHCQEDINPETSHLVKSILKQNITYRKKNCYDQCLVEWASNRKVLSKCL